MEVGRVGPLQRPVWRWQDIPSASHSAASAGQWATLPNAACGPRQLHSPALFQANGHTALQYAELKGHTSIAQLLRQHAAPPQPASAAPAAPPDPVEPEDSAPASLPLEIYESAGRGELQKVVKWVRKGGLVDALCPTTDDDGRPCSFTMLHAAAANGHVEMAKELLRRGASVDAGRG